jgi:hypothetical protein
MGFNSGFKGLINFDLVRFIGWLAVVIRFGLALFY